MAYGEVDDVKDDEGYRMGAGERARAGGLWLVGRPWIVIGVAALVLLGFWVKGTRTQPHEVKVVFDEAVSVYSGLDVRVDGLDAGKVKNIKNQDGRAVITLGIDDDKVWPLHQGTRAALRFGSTIGNGTRQIELMPGPDNAPKIPDGGVIPNADSIESTEFDDIFDTFNSATQKNLRGTLEGTGDTFGSRAKELRSGVRESAGGLDSLGDLTGDLSANEPALRAFIANTYRVTAALQSRRPQISSLVGVAAATFRTFAENTDGIKGSLERFPGTVREARTTLARLDTSVDHLDGLMTDLRPGAVELGRVARELRPTLADLKKTVPVAVATFRSARKNAPSVTRLLEEAQPFSKDAGPGFAGLTPLLTCVRPYSPEIAGLLTQWTSFNQGYDNTGHIGRIWGNAGAAGVTSNPMTPAQYTAATGQGYALIRPPGMDAGKPWFQPECGITPAGLDPKQDPEVVK